MFSILEQFEVLPIIRIFSGIYDVSVTNITLTLFIVFIVSYIFLSGLMYNKTASYYVYNPNRWQSLVEIIYLIILTTIKENVKSIAGNQYVPLVSFVFIYIMSLNLIGLIPYNFTITSQIILVATLSFSLFIGININFVLTHSTKYFSLFLPAGSKIALAIFLVPIELISHFFKPISLSIRVFANMMAGHTLLKIIVGFSYAVIDSYGLMLSLYFLPLILLLPLFVLEFGVAMVQAFVFSTLICIYINESINLH
jgi:ATP synthase subunit 6